MHYTVGITSWCWPDFSTAAMPEIKKAGLDALQLQVGNWEDGLPLGCRDEGGGDHRAQFRQEQDPGPRRP